MVVDYLFHADVDAALGRLPPSAVAARADRDGFGQGRQRRLRLGVGADVERVRPQRAENRRQVEFLVVEECVGRGRGGWRWAAGFEPGVGAVGPALTLSGYAMAV